MKQYFVQEPHTALSNMIQEYFQAGRTWLYCSSLSCGVSLIHCWVTLHDGKVLLTFILKYLIIYGRCRSEKTVSAICSLWSGRPTKFGFVQIEESVLINYLSQSICLKILVVSFFFFKRSSCKLPNFGSKQISLEIDTKLVICYSSNVPIKFLWHLKFTTEIVII